MIELVFVIVIIGILAAVAIPKMTATRDDAKIASIASNLNQIMADTAAVYTATGELNVTTAAQWKNNVTNVKSPDFVFTANTATVQNSTTSTTCGAIVISSGDPKTVTYTAANFADIICLGVHDRLGLNATDNNLSSNLGGNGVKY
jgi:general secretion pathway protein G